MSIQTFTELYQRTVEDRPILSAFLSGHLVVEYLLRKLISIYDPALARLAADMNHARLISLNADLGTISEKQREVLVRINKTRNRFAHEIVYEPNAGELREIFSLAADAFTDLTDGIAQGIDELANCSDVAQLEDYVVPELFVQISYDLHDEYHSRGGDVEDF